MVQVLKDEVRNRIYNAAVQEFYEKNYHSAKMKDIAQRAGVPTGLIYSYYRNKKELFAAIVKPVFKEIKFFLENEEDKVGEGIYAEFTKLEVNFIMEIFKKRKQALILIDKSEGTDFEDAQEKLINLLEKHLREHLSGRIKNIDDSFKDFFYHILADNFMERIFEIFRHFEDINEAERIIEIITKQHFYGVSYFVE